MKTSLYTLAFLAAGARALVAQAPASPTAKPATTAPAKGAAVQQHIPKSASVTAAPAANRQAPAKGVAPATNTTAAQPTAKSPAPAAAAVAQQGAQQQGTPAKKGAAPTKPTATPAPTKGAVAKGVVAKGAVAAAVTGAAAATMKGAAKPGAPAATPPAGKTTAAPAAAAAGAATKTATKAVKDTVVPRVLMRESFDYAPDGRRDPFVSLMNTSDLRPTISDLRLTGILYDLSGRRPVAVMRDVQTNAQYRVTTGMTLGRMRVARIKPKVIVFSIEEFGLNRQDSLVLGDTSRVRTK